MLIIGHRGAAAVAPENTTAGIRRAFDDGADAVEVDVRMTADGRLILLHDATLETTRPGHPQATVPVSAIPFEAIETTVASLDEAWEAAGGRMVLEVKGAWGSGEAGAVAAALARFLEGRDPAAAVVSSFDLLALRAFRDAGGRAATGVLTTAAFDADSNIRAAVDEGHEWCYLPGEIADASAVARAHAAGRRAVAWTVNDPGRIRELAEAEADGIITDDPAAARSALA